MEKICKTVTMISWSLLLKTATDFMDTVAENSAQLVLKAFFI
jgi:hypothetical protein